MTRVELSVTMTQFSLTRRQLARMALVGAATTLIPSAAAAQQAGLAPMPVKLPASVEGPFLAECVPLSAGYALTDTQAKEVALALQDYPGPFAKARAFSLPANTPPAWASTVPPTVNERGRGK